MAKTSIDTDSVFRASLPGETVFSTDMLDFAVHSGFDYPKIEEGFVGATSYEFPTGMSVGEHEIVSVTHNYGYMPMSLVYMGRPSGYYTMLPTKISPDTFGVFSAYTTTTTFKIIVTLVHAIDIAALEGQTYTFKYQIWVND